MASINEMKELLRPIIDEATARAALEGEIHMLEHLGDCLEDAESVETVRVWQQGHLAFLRAMARG